MPDYTATSQYVISPSTPGDISSASVAASTHAPGYGALDISYSRVGKLYFNLRATSVSGGFNNLILDGTAISIAEVASLLGITVNTAYIQTGTYFAGGNSDTAIWNAGGYWEGTGTTSPHTILLSILAN